MNEQGTKEDLIKHVQAHLDLNRALIAVTQGNLKLDKGTSNNKYNWTKQDVIDKYGNVENLINSLADYGFSDGAVLFYRFAHGNTTKYSDETKLSFGSKPKQNLESMEHGQNQQVNHQNNYNPANVQQVPALGFTQVPQNEWINLKVKEERYQDLHEAKIKAEKERDQLESDLRIAKEDLATANRKLETINEKHEFQIEKITNASKSFFETEAGREAIKAAPLFANGILEAIKANKTNAVGLGNPLDNLSDPKRAYYDKFKELPEEVVPLLYDVLMLIIHDENYVDELKQSVELKIDSKEVA